MSKALAVGRKELRQIVRDRRTLLILLFVPAFFLLLYGYALNFDIRHISLAIDDEDKTSVSREIVAAFINSGYFDLATGATDRDIGPLLDRGEVRAVLVIPGGLARSLATGRGAAIQLLVNGDNANTAATVIGYGEAILTALSMKYRATQAPASALLTVEPRIWYNPQLRSTLFLVPGLIAYIAMLTAVVSTALSVVREKERGTMEQVRMAPIGAMPYILGKSIPYFLVALSSALIIIVAAMALFGLPVRGSWWLLLLALGLFLVGALALGLLISSIADSQQVAFQMALLSSLLPTLMLSGFIFPISSMPAWLQAVTYVVPARYFLVVLRGVLLKGSGLEVVWPQLVSLVLFAAGVLALAAARLAREWS